MRLADGLTEHAETEQPDRPAEDDRSAQRHDHTGNQRTAAQDYANHPGGLLALLLRKPPGRGQAGGKQGGSEQKGMHG